MVTDNEVCGQQILHFSDMLLFLKLTRPVVIEVAMLEVLYPIQFLHVRTLYIRVHIFTITVLLISMHSSSMLAFY